MAQGLGRREAQDRADRIRIFRQELAALLSADVVTLTDEQRAAIEAHLDAQLTGLAGRYDIDITDSQKQLSLGMRIVSALGGLALCAAVFLLFYRIWGLISSPVQIAVLIAAPLTGLVAMEVVSRKDRTLYFTELIGLVTFACFVLNLVVIGQLFNVTSSPNAFLAWGAFALTLAYTYSVKVPLVAGLVCLLPYFAGTLMSWTGEWWGGFWSRPELLLLGGLLIVVASAVLPTRDWEEVSGMYLLVGLVTVFYAFLALWHDGHRSWLPLDHKTVEHTYQLLAFVVAGLVIYMGIRFDTRPMVNLGAAYFILCLYLKLVDWWWDWMPKFLFFFLVGAIAITLLLAFRKLRERMA
jgi:uncharacterized membrane protein